MLRILNQLWKEAERHVTIAIFNKGEFSTKEHFKLRMKEHTEMFEYFISQDGKGLHDVILQHLTLKSHLL